MGWRMRDTPFNCISIGIIIPSPDTYRTDRALRNALRLEGQHASQLSRSRYTGVNGRVFSVSIP